MAAALPRTGSLLRKSGSGSPTALKSSPSMGGAEPTAAPASPLLAKAPAPAVSVEDVERMGRAVDGLLKELRVTAHAIKGAEPFDVSRTTLVDWSTAIVGLVTRVEDVLYDFREHANPPPPSSATPAGGTTLPGLGGKLTGGRKFNIADVVKELKSKQGGEADDDSAGVLPPANAGTPRAATTPRIAAGRPAKPPGLNMSDVNASSTPRATSSTAAQRPAVGATAASLLTSPPAGGHHHRAAAAHAPNVAENAAFTQLTLMASSLHVLLDSIARSVQATSATVFVPVNGNKHHLEAICDVGRGPDTLLDALTVRSDASPISLACATGIVITVCRGHEPAAEKQRTAAEVLNEASTSFRESVRMAFSPTNAAAAASRGGNNSSSPSSAAGGTDGLPSSAAGSPKHAIKAPVTSGGGGGGAGGKSRGPAWSSVSVPVRANAGAACHAVLHVTDKLGGRANFEPEDEHLLYGCANAIAAFLQRIEQPRALAAHYQPTRPMPPVQHVPRAARLRVRGEAIDEPHTGIKSQLVWRTWDHPGTVREVLILVKDKAVKLDERVPVMRVYDYIEQLQASWRRSALLNVEFQRAFDQRTAYLTSLVHKLKAAAFKNEALRALLIEQRGVPPPPDDQEAGAPEGGTPARRGAHPLLAAQDRLLLLARAGGDNAAYDIRGDGGDEDVDALYAAARPAFLPPRGQCYAGDASEAESPSGLSPQSAAVGGRGGTTAAGGGRASMNVSGDSVDLIRAIEAESGAAIERGRRADARRAQEQQQRAAAAASSNKKDEPDDDDAGGESMQSDGSSSSGMDGDDERRSGTKKSAPTTGLRGAPVTTPPRPVAITVPDGSPLQGDPSNGTDTVHRRGSDDPPMDGGGSPTGGPSRTTSTLPPGPSRTASLL